jgi:CDP-diacylglycerol--glycerol-3-phosphate 3-phosphatidyltransferase
MTKGNAATLVRLPLSVALVLFIYWGSPWAPWLASLTVILAAIADALDGYLARRDNKVSTLGIYLDAAIDKIFVLSGLICLSNRGLLPVWMVLTIMFRDMLMGGLRSFAAAEQVIIPANQWGKHKTTVTWIALIAVIMQVPYNLWIMLLAVVLSVLSGFIYFYRSRDIWLRSLAGRPVHDA